MKITQDQADKLTSLIRLQVQSVREFEQARVQMVQSETNTMEYIETLIQDDLEEMRDDG